MHDPNLESHREEAHSRMSAMGKKYFKFIEFDKDEELVTEIRKHPFGLFVIELTGVLTIALILAMTFGASWALRETADNFTAGPIIMAVGLILSLIALGLTLISAILYKSNVIFVTTEKLAQVLYESIFNRKISQLSIGDVQDVTVSQKGVFAQALNFGTLVVETAGEQQNYTFTYIPNPYETAKQIVGAHESNLKKFGN